MGEQRRESDALIPRLLEEVQAMRGEVGNLRVEVGRLRDELAANTSRTDQVYEETRDVVKMVNQGRGFFAVCDWIAGKVKMLTLVVGGIGAVLLGFYEYLKSRWLK